MEDRKYKSYDDLPMMLSVPDLASALGISRTGAYELTRHKGFPCIRLGARIIVPKDKFVQWIQINSTQT